MELWIRHEVSALVHVRIQLVYLTGKAAVGTSNGMPISQCFSTLFRNSVKVSGNSDCTSEPYIRVVSNTNTGTIPSEGPLWRRRRRRVPYDWLIMGGGVVSDL